MPPAMIHRIVEVILFAALIARPAEEFHSKVINRKRDDQKSCDCESELHVDLQSLQVRICLRQGGHLRMLFIWCPVPHLQIQNSIIRG